jgi:DNA polymerase-1
MGSGSRKSNIMVVGEAPGEREDDEHRAFVGPAGQLLNSLLGEVGIERDDCYVTNVAKCRPPDNRAPEYSELTTCTSRYLTREIRAVRPSWILLLGNSALRAVTKRSGITKHRGTEYPLWNATCFATFHPAYALRNPKHLPTIQADFRRFAQITRGENATAGPSRVRTVRTKAHLQWLRRELSKAAIISYDIETTGLEEWRPNARIVSISFSWNVGEAYVVPIHHAETPWKDPHAVLRFLKPSLERADARYVAHNGKFDARWLAANGIFVPQGHDTMLSAHMLDENRLKGLKPLSQIILGADGYDVGEEEKRDLYNTPWRKLAVYNGKDTDYTLRLYHTFAGQLREEPRVARVFQKLMMPASNALTQVERRGIWIDPQRLDQRTDTALRNLARIRRVFAKYGGEDVNPNSPQQLGRWLYGDLGFPILETTPTGNPSTREGVLLQHGEHPAIRALMLWRKWAKFESTYLRRWRDDTDHNSRFHANYKLFGTVTGRLSGDFQQVPRDPFIRSIVGAPPGWLFLAADYSQVELRLAAMLAHERSMLRVFATGGDIHLATACELTGKLPGDITSEERKRAKAVNFGFLYGMGWAKFVSYAFESYGVVISDEEAQAFRKRYFDAWPALQSWHDRQRRLVHRYQRVHSAIGRVRHLPDVLSSDSGVAAEAERQAINSPVQSLASDLMLLSLVRLNGVLPPRQAYIVGTIHDEILFQVRESYVEHAAHTIRDVMEDMRPVHRKFGAEITVPIVAEIKIGRHWGEGEVWHRQ